MKELETKIAEIFYDQLKGLYAADPISALEAIKDMIEDRDRTIAKLQGPKMPREEIIRAMDSIEDYCRFDPKTNKYTDEKLCLAQILNGKNIEKIADVLIGKVTNPSQ